jgi:UDP-N-acetylmuramyl pentapeptide phosphotransferase/UDP-N-acetylglucosamine-1-phosphate transferase
MLNAYLLNISTNSHTILLYCGLIAILFISILGYFRVADHYGIIDKPNERSSHTEITIRGGGIIYLVAAVMVLILQPAFLLPCIGLLLIGMISFLDDRLSLSNRIRILFHIVAVTVIFVHVGVFTKMPLWHVACLYIVVIGIINAYNFMDGINGITGAYSLIVLGGLQYVNYQIINFIQSEVIWLPMLASFVFLVFNFRKRAKCFAGDVGSITIALWIVFLLLSLMLKTEDLKYILFLSVYGVDSILTIIHRMMLGQNIFEPHRLHLYQILANDKKISHLVIAVIYMLIQAVIIITVIFCSSSFLNIFLVTTSPLIIGYIILKRFLMTN